MSGDSRSSHSSRFDRREVMPLTLKVASLMANYDPDPEFY